jgi:tetratricopeptide (TPR) repeat protein
MTNAQEPFDLNAVIREYERKRRRNLWLVVGLALLLIVSLAQVVVLTRLRERAYGRPTTLLMLPYLNWNTWYMGDDVLPGAPLALQVSPTGTLWVATSAGLSRANWADWQWQHADWDAGGGTIQPSSLVLVGETAWVMTDGGLARFDGQAWATLPYPDGVTLDTALQMAAADTGLFLLDRSGKIYFLPAGSDAWEQATDLTALAGFTLGDARPEMAVSYGGTENVPSVWVTYRGLWRWSPGGEWQQIEWDGDRLANAHFTAALPEMPWIVTVLNGDEVISFEWAQDQAWPNYFNLTDSGLYDLLPPGTGVSDVIGQSNQAWAVTDVGIYTYKFVAAGGSAWEPVTLPELLTGQIQDLTAMPGGPPVMIARVHESAQTSGVLGRVLGVTSIVSFLALSAGVLWALSRSGMWRMALRDRVRAYHLIQDAVPGLPTWELSVPLDELEPQRPRWKRRWTWLLIKIGAMVAALYIIQRFWPQASRWGFLIVVLIMFASDLLFPSKEERARARLQRQVYLESLADQAKTPQERERLLTLAARSEVAPRRSYLIGTLVVLAVLAVLVVIGLVLARVGAPLFSKIDSSWALGIVLLVIALLGVSYVVTLYPARVLKRILDRGDYDAALQRLETATHGQSRPTQLFFQGTILMLAGRYEEGGQALRACLVAGRSTAAPEQQSVALENLGWALIAQGRYDEAIRALETAIQLRPSGTDSYAVLAEAYLFQGIEPEKALTLARQAVRNKRRRFLWGLLVDRYVYANAWADQAWALALMGRYEEAAKALAQAFRVAEKGFRPAFAGVHYRAGRVKQLMGDWEAALSHHRAAAGLDPVGHYGRLAAQALRELGPASGNR